MDNNDELTRPEALKLSIFELPVGQIGVVLIRSDKHKSDPKATTEETEYQASRLRDNGFEVLSIRYFQGKQGSNDVFHATIEVRRLRDYAAESTSVTEMRIGA